MTKMNQQLAKRKASLKREGGLQELFLHSKAIKAGRVKRSMVIVEVFLEGFGVLGIKGVRPKPLGHQDSLLVRSVAILNVLDQLADNVLVILGQEENRKGPSDQEEGVNQGKILGGGKLQKLVLGEKRKERRREKA